MTAKRACCTKASEKPGFHSILGYRQSFHSMLPRNWSQVVFTDESRFSLKHHDGRTRVWRRLGERSREDCIQPVTPYGGGSVMVWGALYHMQGNLTAHRYMDESLVPLAVPLLRQIGPQTVLQDNTRPHRARLVDNCLQQVGVTRMD